MRGGKSTAFFSCPSCKALFQLVKVEAGPERLSPEVACESCGAPFPGRQGNFVVKYFWLPHPGRRKEWRRQA
jgi:hypothetical protein